jgi:branched-chain amino acid transport system substrate-binding protein
MKHLPYATRTLARTQRGKLIAVVSATSAIAVVLAGCSSSKKSGAAATTSAAPAASTSAAAPAASGSTSAAPSVAATSAATGGSLPSSISVTAIQDLTGAVGAVGIATQNGMNLAVKQINSSGMLGSTQLSISFKDTATTNAQAVSLMSAAAASNTVAIFGPVSSQESVAMAPIAQSSKVPTIFTQSGATGIIEAGNYNFRVTAPQAYFQPKLISYLSAHNIKSVDILYDTDVPTTKGLAEQTLPPLLKAANITVKGSYGIQTTTTDISAFASKIAGENPDAVGISDTNPGVSPAIIALRNAGYKGLIFGGSSFGAASLKAAGAQAKGVVWTTDFDPQSTFPQTVKFVADYKAAYGGAAPNNYAAEGFDAAYLLAYGLKDTTGALSRTTLQAGLTTAAMAGFSGALGQLTFQGNDLREAGYVETFDGAGNVSPAT